MRRRYRWTGETFVEVEPEERLTYREKVEAERELERRETEERERAAHPGTYA